MVLFSIVWYNVFMKRIPKISLWYLVFMLPLVLCIAYLPAKYRIHPVLNKPILVHKRTTYFPSAKTILVGDCTAMSAPSQLFPFPYARITAPNRKLPTLLAKIRSSRFVFCKNVIVIYGIGNIARSESRERVDADISCIVEAITDTYPSASVRIISPYAVKKIADIYNIGDGYHLDTEGYSLLAQLLESPEATTLAFQ